MGAGGAEVQVQLTPPHTTTTTTTDAPLSQACATLVLHGVLGEHADADAGRTGCDTRCIVLADVIIHSCFFSNVCLTFFLFVSTCFVQIGALCLSVLHVGQVTV
jgi:hypothetical protein